MFTVEQVKSLNELELNVYQYVMQHHQNVAYMRIRELAAEAHVSTTTVLHFCKKMGCDGFTEFKWRLKEQIGKQEIDSIPEDLAEIRAFFDRMEVRKYDDRLEAAASMIAKSERVFMIGIGNSGNIGEYGARYFTNLGKFALFISDPFYPMNLMESPSAVAIILSVSGETEQIIKLTNGLKQRKCGIISITNTEQCTLAKLSDINIAYYLTMRRGEENIDYSSQIPAVYLLETLGRRVRNRLAE
ncbi:MAG: MurR/RpiR family transcriptional regulator [Eubacteriales bacterium]|nr:MurR/RpiR family transcriptional regulator [Eubacteriales bacterium]